MKISGYKIEKRIGQGGMANVYLAVQESLDRPVALKVLSPVFSDSPEFSARFLDEGKILASLHHPNIITIYDFGIEDGMHYISMEYVEGKDLKSRINGGIAPDSALDYIETLAGCLQIAHRRNIVHRDVKPANVMFRADGTLLLTDFGIAKRLGGTSKLTVTGSTMGSPYYLSPEQAQSQLVDGRADIYSLGVMLYEMLVGEKPYQGDSDINTILQHITEPFPALPERWKSFAPLLDKMIAKAPADRFDDGTALIDAIRAFRRDAREALYDLDPASEQQAPQPQPQSGPTAAPHDAAPANAGRQAGDESAQEPLPGRERKTLPFIFLGGAALASALIFAGIDTWMVLSAGPTARASIPLKVAAPLEQAVNAPIASPAPNPITGNRPQAPSRPSVPQPSPEPSTQNAQLGAPPPVAAQSSAANAPSLDENTVSAPAAMPTAQSPAMAPTQSGVAPAIAAGVHRDEEIGALLEQAQRAIEEFRLTRPRGNNALSYFQQVLDIEPENEQAKAGPARIADRFGELAGAKVNKRQYARASRYIDRGLAIDASNPRLLALRAEVARAITPAANAPVTEAAAVTAPVTRQRRHREDTPRELYNRVRSFFD